MSVFLGSKLFFFSMSGFFSSFPFNDSPTAPWETSNKENNYNKYQMSQAVAFLFLALIFGFDFIWKSISICNRSVTSCLSLRLSYFFPSAGLFCLENSVCLIREVGGCHNFKAPRMGTCKDVSSIPLSRLNPMKLMTLDHFWPIKVTLHGLTQ